jgi:tetratricopeptide (TPR) repeat protein
MSSSGDVTATFEPISAMNVQTNTAPSSLESDDLHKAQSNTEQHPISDNISFRHWSARQMKKFIVIWLDPNIDESDNDFQKSISQLRQIVSSIKLFIDIEQCVNFIIEIEDANFFLILSAEIGETVVPLIHDTPQLNSIYVFYTHNTKHEQWISAWNKIEGVFSDILSICNQLQRTIKHYERDVIPTIISFAPSAVDLNELNQSFMYSQLLTEILHEMNYEKAAKREFIELCRKQYQDNKVQLHRIDDFERDYERHSALWWYIKESFIVSMLTSALRTQNVAFIIKMGFYIKDLHQEIKQIHSASNKRKKLITYRGQVMANAEFEKLKNNIGCLIAFNNFLSTTTSSEVAILYTERAHIDPELTGIIFQMEIDSSISTIPFVSLGDVNGIPFCENEILFSMHTVFRVDAIEQITNHLWSVDLALTSDTDNQLQRLAESLRKEIEGPNPLHRLGKLLIKMGEFDKAEEIFKTLLETTSNVGLEHVASFYNQLGYIFKEKGAFSIALFNHEKALEIQQKISPPNHLMLANIYNNIGEVHRLSGDYSSALSYYQKTLKIYQESLPSNHPELTTIYNNISQVYNLVGDYSAALSYLQKTLEIEEKSVPSNHPDLAATYENIGRVHYAMGEYSTALLHHRKALEIQEKSLPSNHPSLAITHNNIGQAHYAMGEYLTSLSHHQKALEIQQTSLPFSHPALAATHSSIGRVYDSMGNYSIALSHLQTTLEIQEKRLPSNHPDLATTYENIGRVYNAMGEYSTALLHHQKALKIQEKALPSNHPLVAITHNNIGQSHYAMKEYLTSLSHYEKAFEIQQMSLPSNHPDLATTLNNFGKTYVGMDDYLKAISYYKKTLKIQLVALPFGHPSLAVTYNNIGRVHELQEHYSDALFYYEKALKIQQKALPFNHPSLAATYNSISEMHRLTGDYSSALVYYKNILEIRTKSLASNHSSLAESHHHIAVLLEGLQQYDEAVNHASCALNIARHSFEPDQSQMLKYQKYLDEILLIPECSELAKIKNINE